MEKKLYYAYVLNDDELIKYFAKKCREINAKIVSEESAISENGESLIYYVIEAEEGFINPEWELK